MMGSLRSRALLVFTAFSLAACGDDTKLPTDLSTADAMEDIAITTAAFETPQSLALVDLSWAIDDALYNLGGGAATLASVVAAGPGVEQTPSADLVERIERSTSGPMAAMPASALGKTFEWSTGSGSYVIGDRPGAPANGVRFVLYEVLEGAYEPVEPLVEVGYATITQGGSASKPTATLVVQAIGGATVLSYTATIGGTQNAPTFNVVGTAGTGPNAATFSLQVGVNIVQQKLTATWRTEIPSRGLVTRTTLGINPNTGAITLNGLMQRGLRKIEIVGTFNTELGGQLTVQVGGKTFARITMNGEDGVAITNPDGEPLTAEEEETLELIFEWFASSLDWYGGLISPVSTALGMDE